MEYQITYLWLHVRKLCVRMEHTRLPKGTRSDDVNLSDYAPSDQKMAKYRNLGYVFSNWHVTERMA